MEELKENDNLDFSNIIYNLSWEDGECDIVEYDIIDGSRICMITTGGDNVLVYLTKNIESIHTFDLNPYQNFLLEMKMSIILSCNRDEALRILGKNDYTLFMKKYDSLRRNLRTDEAKTYWDKPKNQCKFKSFFLHGSFRTILNIGKVVKVLAKNHMANDLISEICKQTASLQGIPFRQYELYGGFGKQSADYAKNTLQYLDDNKCLDSYFYTGYINGQWDESSLPLYLQRKWYDIVKKRINIVTIITGTILDCVDDNHPINKFTHINLLDSQDWMPDEYIASQMNKLSKYSDSNTRICFRSASPTQPFTCLLNQNIKSKNIWTDSRAVVDRVGTYNSIHVMTFNYNYPIILKQDVNYKRDIQKDFITMGQMLFPQTKQTDVSKGVNNSKSLDAFYKSQAEYYDNYRSRMLHGKSKLMGMIPYFDGMEILLFAGGTADISRYIPNIPHKITCMDLCQPLLDVARKRYPQMKTVRADGEKYISKTKMDFVICSYSLTMIPDWKSAIECMVKSCKKKGYICCSDFVVCGDNIIRDTIVKAAFAQDHVHLNADHIRYLDNHPKLKRIRVCIEDGDFPLMPSIYKSSYYYGVWKRL
jgi:S-adenosylmethionine:diacylglycerol 3-amino-3-carboxypropyl transferase/ubiquinone/menaquinone biosynthesis C-methylase UbiE